MHVDRRGLIEMVTYSDVDSKTDQATARGYRLRLSPIVDITLDAVEYHLFGGTWDIRHGVSGRR
ncbi:hypothetical protein C353_04277 [Cryptococcus neoformans AD1-83a]|nr:hypothetical protein C353_04277 [Cryptococcus neoformans var. grubii AD1-83a]